jgi:hypothetical protein
MSRKPSDVEKNKIEQSRRLPGGTRFTYIPSSELSPVLYLLGGSGRDENPCFFV